LEEAERDSYDKALIALRSRLDTGSKVMAAQDFCHLAQEEKEEVTDFICRLERTFHLAYGHNSMTAETRDARLFGQLQEGLKYGLMESPAVLGATSYQSLCIAAKSEERRQAALKKRKQYQGDHPPSSQGPSRPPNKPPGTGGVTNQAKPATKDAVRKCWNCDKVGHLAKDCQKPKKESMGRTSQKSPSAKVVHSVEYGTQSAVTDDPMDYLLSDSDECEVRQIRVQDQGSVHQQARVIVGGVPMLGVVDTGADVTIMGGSMFKRVAAAAKLRKRDFKPC